MAKGQVQRALLNPTVLAAVVGLVASLLVALIQRPSTISETKESISAITVGDERLRQLAHAVTRLETPKAVASGFLIDQRYLVTTSLLLGDGTKSARVYRRFGEPDSVSFALQPAIQDSISGITVFDLRVPDTRATNLQLPGEVNRQTLGRIFTLGYIGGKVLSVREGRIVADRIDHPEFYHQDLQKYHVPAGTLVADIQVPRGMAGAPVFLKDGSLLGFIYLALDPGIALVIPSTYVGDAILRVKGGS